MSLFIEEIPSLRAGALGHGHHTFEGKTLNVAAPAGACVISKPERRCALPVSAAEIKAGDFGVLPYYEDKIALASGLEYEADQTADIVVEGFMVVLTEEAVEDGDPVFIRHTADLTHTQLGTFLTSNGADGEIQLTVNVTADGAVLSSTIDGVLFHQNSGTSQTAAQKATAYAAIIDAHADFSATAVGDLITVEALRGDLSNVSPSLTITSQGLAARPPGNLVFRNSYPAGAALVRLK